MAITIRNKRTEELIRRIGRRTGEGPSAVVARAVNALDQTNVATASQEEYRRKLTAFEELRKAFPPPDPKPTWAELEREMDEIFDYLDDEPVDESAGRHDK